MSGIFRGPLEASKWLTCWQPFVSIKLLTLEVVVLSHTYTDCGWSTLHVCEAGYIVRNLLSVVLLHSSNTYVLLTEKGDNCNALQLEAVHSTSHQSFSALITRPIMHQRIKFKASGPCTAKLLMIQQIFPPALRNNSPIFSERGHQIQGGYRTNRRSLIMFYISNLLFCF